MDNNRVDLIVDSIFTPSPTHLLRIYTSPKYGIAKFLPVNKLECAKFVPPSRNAKNNSNQPKIRSVFCILPCLAFNLLA